LSIPLAGIALALHIWQLHFAVMPGGQFTLTLTSAISIIGLQLALIAALAAFDSSLRGISSILFVIAAAAGSLTYIYAVAPADSHLTWQLQTHIALSMFAYGLLTAGAIVAVLALIQDIRLRAGKLSSINHLFAPLETTEKLLYGIATAGFVVLAMSVVSGFTFVENLFAQHLVHKTVLSLLALATFGTLVIGRQIAGWRGRRAVYLYLGGFLLLGLAYFGTRYVLEEILQRSWA
jgi:ABC-type uncharacterized transport system permease subunit